MDLPGVHRKRTKWKMKNSFLQWDSNPEPWYLKPPHFFDLDAPLCYFLRIKLDIQHLLSISVTDSHQSDLYARGYEKNMIMYGS